jgi:hypothetical protein
MRLPTLCLVREKMSELPEFSEIGKRMLLAWQEGVTNLRDRRVYSAGDWPADKRLKVSPTRQSWKIPGRSLVALRSLVPDRHARKSSHCAMRLASRTTLLLAHLMP